MEKSEFRRAWPVYIHIGSFVNISCVYVQSWFRRNAAAAFQTIILPTFDFLSRSFVYFNISLRLLFICKETQDMNTTNTCSFP